jgi:DNA polymerase III psi subunit
MTMKVESHKFTALIVAQRKPTLNQSLIGRIMMGLQVKLESHRLRIEYGRVSNT